MRNLTILLVTGESLSLTVPEDVATTAVAALSQQLPAQPFYVDDVTTMQVNMRHVVSITTELIPEEDTRTVAQLKEALDAAKIEYPSGALKAELLELARTNNV